MSNLPTGTTFSFIFIRSKTVSLLNWSFAVVTYPIGLFSSIYILSSTFFTTFPSKVTSSLAGFTFVPNSVIIFPFTFTFPANIYSSAFRLEHIPLLAKSFCNLICSIIFPFIIFYIIYNFSNISLKYCGSGAISSICFLVVGSITSTKA